jgi:hypothetical protein
LVALSVMALLTLAPFASGMPGGMLCALKTGPIANDRAVEASSRVPFSRPGLRFCGMALET